MTAENDSENTLSKVDVQIRVAETSHQENVVMQILAPNRRKLVASPAYLKYKGTPEQVSDLNKHSLITLESRNQYNDWHFRLNETTTETFRAHGNLCPDSGDAILRTILNGGGLSMMSTYTSAITSHREHWCQFWKQWWMSGPRYTHFGVNKTTASRK